MIKSVMTWKWKNQPFSYNITDEDYVNLVRAVQYEGKPQYAILWTLLQRFALLKSAGTYDNLTKFLQAYVQPINPRWFPTGDLYKKYVEQYKNNPERLAQEKEIAAKRMRKASTPLDNLTVESISIVDNVLSGGNPISPAPTSVHYWASRADKSMTQEQAKKYNAAIKPGLTILDLPSGFLPGVNVFFTIPEAKNLSNLKFKLPGKSEGFANLALLAILSTLGYFFLKG